MQNFLISQVFLAVFLALSSPALAVETVTVLDRGEPYDSMVTAKGILWVGKSRQQFNANYQLEAYDMDGRLVDRTSLSHSLSTMKLTGSGDIVVTGINPQSRLSEYTTAKLENGKIRTLTKGIGLGALITFWISKIGSLQYFVDIGGNPDDSSDPALQLPAQTIFASSGSNSKYLTARVRMPVAGIAAGDKILLVSSEGMSQDGSSIVEVDPNNASTRIITKSTSAKYRGIEFLDATKEILTMAVAESKVRLIDLKTGETRREFSTHGYARSLAIFGHCAVVGSEETNVVEAFDLSSQSERAVFVAKVDLPMQDFSGLKTIAIDKESGAIFARASYACNPLIEACDHDNNRVVKFEANVSRHLGLACQ